MLWLSPDIFLTLCVVGAWNLDSVVNDNVHMKDWGTCRGSAKMPCDRGHIDQTVRVKHVHSSFAYLVFLLYKCSIHSTQGYSPKRWQWGRYTVVQLPQKLIISTLSTGQLLALTRRSAFPCTGQGDPIAVFPAPLLAELVRAHNHPTMTAVHHRCC